jgi:hypothetical protein
MGQQRTNAPQQTNPWFDHQIGGKPRRSPFHCILGRDGPPMKRLADDRCGGETRDELAG